MNFKQNLAVLLLYIAISSACGHTIVNTYERSVPNEEWQTWKRQYGKVYGSLEVEEERFAAWENNYKLVKEHNSKPDATFEMEMNFLADQISNSVLMPLDVSDANYQLPEASERIKISPDKWDWRGKGAIGPVQDQGILGDSQAIVAEECVESYHAIHTGQLTLLSVMEVYDCCSPPRVTPDNVFQCIHNIGGLCSAADYPQFPGSCSNNTCSAAAQIKGGKAVPKADENAMKDAVYQTPLMALVDASHASFQMYMSGVYKEPACSSSRVDHVLQVVGYGSMNGQDYWICKNSFGANWGMQGYILIARNADNMCGIASMTTYPM